MVTEGLTLLLDAEVILLHSPTEYLSTLTSYTYRFAAPDSTHPAANLKAAGFPPAISSRTSSMSSPKQTEANRLNAKKSTGPRTPAGKAKSRFNALKAGIDAGAEAIPGEDPDDLRALREDYYQRFTPDRPEQYALVDALIAKRRTARRSGSLALVREIADPARLPNRAR